MHLKRRVLGVLPTICMKMRQQNLCIKVFVLLFGFDLKLVIIYFHSKCFIGSALILVLTVILAPEKRSK